MARSTFYYRIKALAAPDKYAELKSMIREIFERHKGWYGYRRITLELNGRGHAVNNKTVLKLMNECGLKCRIRARKYRYHNGQKGETFPNTLNREFHVLQPNHKWAIDVTEFNIGGAKLFLSPIIDMFNGEVISYDISSRQTFKQTMNTLDKALEKLPAKANPLLHSDQGWQYRMRQYQQKLAAAGIQQSMSRKGNCWDNAVIESFFAVLKSELFYNQTFSSYNHFRKELVEYIDYYNNRRIKSGLNGLSPVQYRNQYLKNNL